MDVAKIEKKLKIYIIRDDCFDNNCHNYNEFIKYIFKYGHNKSLFDFVNLFEITNNIMHADIVIFPYNYQYYNEISRYELFIKDLLDTHKKDKRIVLFSEGDYFVNFPMTIPKVYLFEKSSYKSRNRLENVDRFAYPPFISDYLKIYCNNEMQYRKKGDTPILGFCGHAGGNIFDFMRRSILCSYRKLAFRLNLLRYEPAPFETTKFRHNILKNLSKSKKLKTNFILRTRYRAGYLIRNKDPFHPTRIEFINNIINSDYTICIRGAGNFSVRLYETLSLGRIPIFVDTDSLLPYDHLINYKNYFVWIDKEEIPYMEEKVLDFHYSISQSDFLELQNECRNLWVEWLSKDGFFYNLINLFMNI